MLDGLTATVNKDFKRMLLRPFSMKRRKVVVALESSGECLKLAQVQFGAKGKKIVKLVARTAVLQEDLSKTLMGLVEEGFLATDSVLISIPRNLVTVRNLQLPTTDPQELKEMVNLQAVKQTPFLKDEIIADFHVVRSSPEGYTDVILVTTHRSVPNANLKTLDEANLQGEGVRLSSQGVFHTYLLLQGISGDQARDPVAIVDIDSSFSDFMVVEDGQICFTKALSVGPAKLMIDGEGGEKEVEKFTEEIQRAVDIYGNEGIGERISKLVMMGAEVDIPGLIPGLRAKLHIPVERISLTDGVEVSPEMLDLPDAQRESLSFSAVLGLAWEPDASLIDLTPPEVRLRESLAQKGKAMTSLGVLVIIILMATTLFVSQQIYSRKQYLEQLNQEVQQTQKEANEVEAMRTKIKLIRDASGSENSSLEILTVLHKNIPADIYLKSINFEAGSHLILKGVAEKMSEVFGFLATLEKQPNFHHVRTKHVTRSTRKGGKGEIDFEMTCLLAKNDEA
jgi:Tfp pilus assembly PilM family ATPase/Tfp pilus assembly protein PilN